MRISPGTAGIHPTRSTAQSPARTASAASSPSRFGRGSCDQAMTRRAMETAERLAPAPVLLSRWYKRTSLHSSGNQHRPDPDPVRFADPQFPRPSAARHDKPSKEWTACEKGPDRTPQAGAVSEMFRSVPQETALTAVQGKAGSQACVHRKQFLHGRSFRLSINRDGFVKSPYAVLPFFPRPCGIA